MTKRLRTALKTLTSGKLALDPKRRKTSVVKCTAGLAASEDPANANKVGVFRDEGVAGVIRGYSAIQRGEALGHGFWVDDYFLDQVVEHGNASEHGIKSRFCHPGLSADGMGKLLGRSRNFRKVGDRVLADLHLAQSATKTPDGDLANYVMTLADEDPKAFGASIVFHSDFAAEDEFRITHLDDNDCFVSPDEDNVNHYMHARLEKLEASDVVDEPAANRDGFLSAIKGSEVPQTIESIMDYAFGVSDDVPAEFAELGLSPERVRQFASGWKARRELEQGLTGKTGTQNRVGKNAKQEAGEMLYRLSNGELITKEELDRRLAAGVQLRVVAMEEAMPIEDEEEDGEGEGEGTGDDEEPVMEPEEEEEMGNGYPEEDMQEDEKPLARPAKTKPLGKPAVTAKSQAAQMNMLCDLAGVPRSRTADALAAGLTVQQFQKSLHGEVSRKPKRGASQALGRIEMGEDRNIATLAPAMACALALAGNMDESMVRKGIKKLTGKDTLPERVDELRGRSMAQLGQIWLEAKGKRGLSGMHKHEIFDMLMSERRGVLSAKRLFSSGNLTGSDFPALTTASAYIAVMAGLATAETSYAQLCRSMTVETTSNTEILGWSDAPRLRKVNEDGEIERAYFTDTKQNISVDYKGIIVPFTEEFFVNNRVEEFTSALFEWGMSVENQKNEDFWTLVKSNPTLTADDTALFHANHGNLGAGAPLSSTAINAMFKFFMAQSGINDQKTNTGVKRKIAVKPKFIAVPPALMDTAWELAYSTVKPGTNQGHTVNVWEGKFTPVVEPELGDDDTRYFGFADPAILDCFRSAELAGRQGVTVDSRTGFETLGQEIRVVSTWGFAPSGRYQAGFRDSGVAPE